MGRTRYSLEYRKEAVALAERIGPKKAAQQLGVAFNSIKTWQKVLKDGEPARTEKLSQEEQIRRLEKENQELKKVNFILKKAAAFFSRDHLD